MRPNIRYDHSSEMCIYILLLVYLNTNGVLGFYKSSLFEDIISLIPKAPAPEDAYLNIRQLAEKYKYPFEEHTVVTEDGYILRLHRLPHGRNRQPNGLAVLLMHGISDSSDSWMLLGPDIALAYVLADAGYDVWMGNARGNKHSGYHVSMDVKSSAFWSFSWDEIGVYDLPAMIDYALGITGQKSLYYIGFSQGTTAFFALISLRPEYNSKIKLMIALGPEVFMGHARNPVLNILSHSHVYVTSLLTRWNIYSSMEDLLITIGPLMCRALNLQCENDFYSVHGPNHVKDSMWPIILGHSPSGTSTFQYIHYVQLADSMRFRRYDHGVVGNLKRYGQNYPPDYDLNNVRVPIIIFYGEDDWYADPRDVKILIDRLPNVKKAYYLKKYAHSDFMYGENNKDLINSFILKHFNEVK